MRFIHLAFCIRRKYEVCTRYLIDLYIWERDGAERGGVGWGEVGVRGWERGTKRSSCTHSVDKTRHPPGRPFAVDTMNNFS